MRGSPEITATVYLDKDWRHDYHAGREQPYTVWHRYFSATVESAEMYIREQQRRIVEKQQLPGARH